MEHHKFMMATDRKSLYMQIKTIVAKAKEEIHDDLVERRLRLQTLLEDENRLYEQEFTFKVRSRIDLDIQARKEKLLKIKQENTKTKLAFLEQKRIQQNISSCYEVREALRLRDSFNVKECQLEQILEKERAQARQQELDVYWQNVTKVRNEQIDKMQAQEDCIKQKLKTHCNDFLALQVEDMQRRREKERQSKDKERQDLNELLETIRLEEFDKKLLGVPEKMHQYRRDLLDLIHEKKCAQAFEREQRVAEERKMIEELKRLENEETAAAIARKRACYKATMAYIDYTKRMRGLEDNLQKMRNDRIDDLYHMDICTKNNIAAELERKAKMAAACHEELKRQICEQYERRLREEAEYKEEKIIENRFVRNDITREQILEQRRENRKGLDRQIAELKKYRAAETLKYEQQLRQAVDDPTVCAELAKRYIAEGVDCLEPHANWRIQLCPTKEYTDKEPQAFQAGAKGRGCIKPCGCAAGSCV